MTIRSKIFEKFVDERGASHAAVLRRMEDGVVLMFPQRPKAQGQAVSRVRGLHPPSRRGRSSRALARASRASRVEGCSTAART